MYLGFGNGLVLEAELLPGLETTAVGKACQGFRRTKWFGGSLCFEIFFTLKRQLGDLDRIGQGERRFLSIWFQQDYSTIPLRSIPEGKRTKK